GPVRALVQRPAPGGLFWTPSTLTRTLIASCRRREAGVLSERSVRVGVMREEVGVHRCTPRSRNAPETVARWHALDQHDASTLKIKDLCYRMCVPRPLPVGTLAGCPLAAAGGISTGRADRKVCPTKQR